MSGCEFYIFISNEAVVFHYPKYLPGSLGRYLLVGSKSSYTTTVAAVLLIASRFSSFQGKYLHWF